MTDPLDVAKLLTGAVSAVAVALPEPVRTVARLLDAGLSLATSLRDAGLDPLASIVTMERALVRFDDRTRVGRDRLNAALDALGVAPLATADTIPPPAPDGATGAPARTVTAEYPVAAVEPPEGGA